MTKHEDAKKRTIERLAGELAGHMNKREHPAQTEVYYGYRDDDIIKVTFTHRGKKVEISDPSNALPMGVKNAVTTVKQAVSYKAWLTARGFITG